MPRYRGTYNSSETYVYNSEYRDIVIYNGNAYIVKSYGYSGSAIPTNSSYWEQSSKFSFVAMDTALIDGANIAGFMFKNQKMQSQTGTLTLDGINGSIDARKGTIGGFTLSNNSLSTTGSNASIKFEINGYNFLRLNDTSSSAFLTARADGKTAASFSTYGTNNSSVALNLICNASGYGYALKSNGNVDMAARSGETVKISGLSLAFRRTSSSTTITSADNIIMLPSKVNYTITFSSNCPVGHIVILIPTSPSKVILNGGSFYDQAGNYKGTSWELSYKERNRMFIRSDSGWHEFYCAV